MKTFALESGTLERLALAGGVPASIIVLMIIVQVAVIKAVPDRKARTRLIYVSCGVEVLAAIAWLAIDILKEFGG